MNYQLFKFNGTTWDSVGAAVIAEGGGGGASKLNLTIDPVSNNPVVAYSERTTGKLSVMMFDGTNWNYYNNGQEVSTGVVDHISLFFW